MGVFQREHSCRYIIGQPAPTLQALRAKRSGIVPYLPRQPFSTLRHGALETQIFLAGTLLILGIVYYLVARSQQVKNLA